MFHEEKKAAKIVEELTMFFFTLGSDRIQSGIDKDGKQTVITFHANFNPVYKEKLNRLEDYLNGPKNDGIEDVYWELAGSGDPGETSQLLLVGMMIDRAEIEIGEIEISLKLYKDQFK